MRRQTWRRGNKEDGMGTALMGSIKLSENSKKAHEKKCEPECTK